MQFRTAVATAIVLALTLSLPMPVSAAGPLLFDKAEYAARRARLIEKIPDGVAVLLGATPTTGGEFFQNNDMMYFTGVEIPNAALIIDGRSKTSTLFFTITDAAPATKASAWTSSATPRPSPASSAWRPSTSSRRRSPGSRARAPCSTRRSSPRNWPARRRPRSSPRCRTR